MKSQKSVIKIIVVVLLLLLTVLITVYVGKYFMYTRVHNKAEEILELVKVGDNVKDLLSSQSEFLNRLEATYNDSVSINFVTTSGGDISSSVCGYLDKYNDLSYNFFLMNEGEDDKLVWKGDKNQIVEKITEYQNHLLKCSHFETYIYMGLYYRCIIQLRYNRDFIITKKEKYICFDRLFRR